eukprot:588204-Rhodomonas_salina.1
MDPGASPAGPGCPNVPSTPCYVISSSVWHRPSFGSPMPLAKSNFSCRPGGGTPFDRGTQPFTSLSESDESEPAYSQPAPPHPH